ncbi:MAG: Zn-ribbon domain-containing OB-fold protein [Chloroflexi bacterium]|nr:Zn-ribbon domain-containing OB-fold protein [Chloroflexota bacterium]
MTTSAGYRKPLPYPENREFTKPFWDAAKRHELVLPRCKQCAMYHFYPRETCPNCFSLDIEWVPASGRGRVYAFTIVHQAAHPAFQEETPYVHAVIQLDEGVRMISNVVGCAPTPEEVKVDMPVVVTFDDVTPEWTLPKFRPA